MVAFNANTPTDKHPLTNQVIVFSHPVFNIGNAYNSGTGVFTAPVTGVYMFTAHFCTYSGKYWNYALVKEEENSILKGTAYDKDTNQCATASTVVQLQSKERVWIECTSDPGADVFYEDSHRKNVFSRSLLHALYV